MAWINMAFPSRTLHMPVEAEILAPERLSEQGRPVQGRWPVLVLLHGKGEDRTQWLLKSSVARYAEGLPILVCMPSGKNSRFANTENGYRYGDFVTEELPQLLKRLFAVSEKKADWLIGGIREPEQESGASWLSLAERNYGGAVLFDSPEDERLLAVITRLAEANRTGGKEVL